MGATKLTNYTEMDLETTYFGNLVAHPARLIIARGLIKNEIYRNIDLVSILNLSKGSVRTHVQQFLRADVIDIEYQMHYYLIRLKPEWVEDLRGLVEAVDRSQLQRAKRVANL